MSCKECDERRDKVRKAWLEKDLKETVKQVVIGATEMVGVTKKTKFKKGK